MGKICMGLFLILSFAVLAEDTVENKMEVTTSTNPVPQTTQVGNLPKKVGIPEEAKRDLNGYLNMIKNDDIAIFRLGDEYFKQRKYETALKIFKTNLSTARNEFGAGTCYRLMGKYNEAIEHYSGAIEKNKNFGEAYLGRGLAYRELGDIGSAEDDFKSVLELKKSETAYLALADIYISEKQNSRAREIVSEGIKNFPNSKELKRLYNYISR